MPNAPDLTSPAALAALFGPVLAARRIALAVSGGADSTALLDLYARFAAAHPDLAPALVLTVDHGLRATSALEAAAVAVHAARLGLPHQTLAWIGPKPAANLQDAARRARYGLLLDAARAGGCDMILTAHTSDDQAETFLLALARGSGVYGLAAMPVRRDLGGVTLLRPLLDVSRAALRAHLERHGIGWAEDPSNADPRFARIRMRRALGDLAALGLTVDRLAETARSMARAADALDQVVDRLIAAKVQIHPGGFARLEADLLDEPDEIALRLLARLLRRTGGAAHVPRLERLQALRQRLRAALRAGHGVRHTLSDTLAVVEAGALWLAPEAGRTGFGTLTLAPGMSGLWAGRVEVRLAAAAPGPVDIQAIGPSGARHLRKAGLADVPPAILATVPGGFADGALVAIPAFNLALSPFRVGEITVQVALPSSENRAQ